MKRRYHYSIRTNRWTWIGAASAILFCVAFTFQSMSKDVEYADEAPMQLLEIAEPLELSHTEPSMSMISEARMMAEPEIMKEPEIEKAPTLIERVLELINLMLDKLIQLATALMTLVGLWKSIHREKKDEPEDEE